MTTINNEQDFLRALRENPEWKDAVRGQILGEELLKLPVQFNEFKDRVDKFIGRQEEFNHEVTARFDRMEGDISTVKAGHARSVGREAAEAIAIDLGMEYVRTLTAVDLIRLCRQAGGDLPTNELRSFQNADLVIEAVQELETVYIPVEIPFNADHRDSDRAIRNAELLYRFTGNRAVATVASICNDRHVTGLVESQALHWHEMDAKHMERLDSGHL